MNISPSHFMEANAAESEQLPAQPVSDYSASREGENVASARSDTLFENPFSIEDLMVFDDAAMQYMLSSGGFGLTIANLARSMHQAPAPLVKRVKRNLSSQQRMFFTKELHHPLSKDEVKAARQRVLDSLFWELTYWKTPNLYEELTEGEQLHPGIFQQLAPDLRGKIVLDAGAGCGRASFECLRHGAAVVYAVEPSPGLLHILVQKLVNQPTNGRIVPYRGRFDNLPLAGDSVDIALACSAFTAEAEQGGEPGLAELTRVTKPGGKIVLIWPRTQDRDWLAAHGFQYVALPIHQEMRVRFRSLHSALRCARRFYTHNRAVVSYMLEQRQPEVPFSVLGFNPPCDYCWLTVK